jgi:hypothetical protein
MYLVVVHSVASDDVLLIDHYFDTAGIVVDIVVVHRFGSWIAVDIVVVQRFGSWTVCQTVVVEKRGSGGLYSDADAQPIAAGKLFVREWSDGMSCSTEKSWCS